MTVGIFLWFPGSGRCVDEARRVFSQIVTRGSPGPPPTAATQPPVWALAAVAFQEGLPFSQVLEDG